MICPKCHHPNSLAQILCRGCQHPLRHAKLRVVYANDKEQNFDLLHQDFSIGREPKHDLALHDDAVSRMHACLRFAGGAFHAEDLESKNGTYLNGARIRTQALAPLDCLQIGTTRIYYVMQEITHAAATTRPTTSATSRGFARASTSGNVKQRSKAEKLFEHVLQPLLHGALQLAQAQRATLWLPDSGNDLIPRLSAGVAHGPHDLALEHEIARKVFHSGATVVRTSQDATATFAEGLMSEDAFHYQLLGAPFRRVELASNARPPCGALLLQSQLVEHGLSPARLERLKFFFTQAEMHLGRVESAVTLLQQFEANATTSVANSAADKVQQLLAPVAIPRMSGYDLAGWHHPAEKVSGDYLDVVPLDSGEVVLAVGDVAGRGLAAATTIFALQTALRLLLLYESDLGRIMAVLNRVAHAVGGSAIFTTLFLAKLEPQRRVLHYVNAGHTPGMFIHSIATTPAVELVHSNATALGVMETCNVEPKQLFLPPASALLLFTDGLTEARNEEGEQYGLARLTERVVSVLLASRQTSAARVLEKLREELTLYSADFHAKIRHIDDQAALALLVR